jgi:hypothetical protein
MTRSPSVVVRDAEIPARPPAPESIEARSSKTMRPAPRKTQPANQGSLRFRSTQQRTHTRPANSPLARGVDRSVRLNSTSLHLYTFVTT